MVFFCLHWQLEQLTPNCVVVWNENHVFHTKFNKIDKKKLWEIDATGHTHLQNQEKNQICSISSHGSWHKLQPIKWLYAVFLLICVLMTQFNKSMYLIVPIAYLRQAMACTNFPLEQLLTIYFWFDCIFAETWKIAK